MSLQSKVIQQNNMWDLPLIENTLSELIDGKLAAIRTQELALLENKFSELIDGKLAVIKQRHALDLALIENKMLVLQQNNAQALAAVDNQLSNLTTQLSACDATMAILQTQLATSTRIMDRFTTMMESEIKRADMQLVLSDTHSRIIENMQLQLNSIASFVAVNPRRSRKMQRRVIHHQMEEGNDIRAQNRDVSPLGDTYIGSIKCDIPPSKFLKIAEQVLSRQPPTQKKTSNFFKRK